MKESKELGFVSGGIIVALKCLGVVALLAIPVYLLYKLIRWLVD